MFSEGIHFVEGKNEESILCICSRGDGGHITGRLRKKIYGGGWGTGYRRRGTADC
jgi:hypothetical protein